MKGNAWIKLVWVAGGFGLGWLTAAVWQPSDEPPPEPEAERAPVADVAAMADELAVLREANAELSIEKLELQRELTQARQAFAPTPAVPFEEPAEGLDEETAARLERWTSRMLSRTDARAQKLAQVLGLDPTQQMLFNGLVDQVKTHRAAVLEARLTEGSSPGAPPDWESELSSFLRPDQLAALDAYQAELQEGRLATMASAQLTRYTSGLGLSEAQKDQAFTVYFQAGADALEANASGADYDYRRAVDNGMASILTPEQLALYQQSVVGDQGPPLRGGGGGGGLGLF